MEKVFPFTATLKKALKVYYKLLRRLQIPQGKNYVSLQSAEPIIEFSAWMVMSYNICTLQTTVSITRRYSFHAETRHLLRKDIWGNFE